MLKTITKYTSMVNNGKNAFVQPISMRLNTRVRQIDYMNSRFIRNQTKKLNMWHT